MAQAAYTILSANRPRFQPLLPPRPAKKPAGVQMQALPAPAAAVAAPQPPPAAGATAAPEAAAEGTPAA